MILLIQSRTLDVSATTKAVLRTFDRRGTHATPTTLESPPPDWSAPFQRMADECHLDHSVMKAFAELREFYATLRLAR
jgi:hypothetical protein